MPLYWFKLLRKWNHKMVYINLPHLFMTHISSSPFVTFLLPFPYLFDLPWVLSHLRLSIDAFLFLWKSTTNCPSLYPQDTHPSNLLPHTSSYIWFLLMWFFTSQLKNRDALCNHLFFSTNIILHLWILFMKLTKMYLFCTLFVCFFTHLWSFLSTELFMRTQTIY